MTGSKVQCRSLLITSIPSMLLLLCIPETFSDPSPQLLDIHLKKGYLEMESEYSETKRTASGSVIYEDEYLGFQPTLHLNFEGSVYHPKLFDGFLSVELGTSFERQEVDQPQSAEPKRSRSNVNPLQLYDGSAVILQEKRLSGQVFGHHHRIRSDNDIFSRRLVRQTGRGAKLNYSGDTLPWTLTVSHEEEEEINPQRPREKTQDELRFNASNKRGAQNRTQFSYVFQEFERQFFSSAPYTGTRNYMQMNDSTYFLNRDLHLVSSINNNDIDSSANSQSALAFRERLTVRHTDDLNSSYQYTYGARTSAGADSKNQTGRATLQHQLYDSLASSVSADFRDTKNPSVDSFRQGASLAESYTKRTGEFSILNLGATISRHYEEREAREATIRIDNESHMLTTGVPTLLNLSNIIEPSIVVSDPGTGFPYVDGVDYIVTPIGDFIEIQRIVGGGIPDGANVNVSYDADNPGSGSFTSQQDRYHFRYSIMDQLLSVYGHLQIIENTGENSLIFENLRETVLGLDSSWKWFQVGVEYQDYDSSLLPRKTVRTYQKARFFLPGQSVLQLSADQSTIKYLETDDEIKRYFYKVGYHTMITSHLSFKIDGSAHVERGRTSLGLNRDLLAANAKLVYKVGKATLSATGEYRSDDYSNGTHARRAVYLRLRRNF